MLPPSEPDRIRIAFDDHRLVANAGLLLPVTLAQHLGLRELVGKHVDLGDAPGRANAGDKMLTLVASALAGGDCIDDADVLRTGGTADATWSGKACGVSLWRLRLETEESIPRMECGKCRGHSANTSRPRQTESRTLRRRSVDQDGTVRQFPLLPQPEAPSDPGLPDPSRGVPGGWECPGGGIARDGRPTGTGIVILYRSSGTLA